MAIVPTNPQALHDLIIERIVTQGHACSLNDIDVSQLSDFSQMFKGINFQGDISQWNVSGATNMHEMFKKSTFNGDISRWNVARVQDMSFMFEESKFDQPIENWDVTGVRTMRGMFRMACFNQPLAAWDVSKVQDLSMMFRDAPYACDLNGWRPSSARTVEAMLWDSAYAGSLSDWRLREDCNTDYLLNPLKLATHDKPSVYHFRLMYTEHADFHVEWQVFVEAHRNIIDGLGIDSKHASVWLHALWYDGPVANESLGLFEHGDPPSLNFHNTE